MMSIFHEGNATIIYGNRGFGKSDLWMLHLHDAGKNLGYKVMANAPSYLYPSLATNPYVKLVGSDIEILNFFLDNRERIVLGLDEANVFQSAKMSQNDVSKNLEALGSVIRKFGMSIYFVIQRKDNMLLFWRETAYCMIFKESLTTAKISINDRTLSIVNIPPCKKLGVTYNTKDFAGLKFYLNLVDLINDISSMPYEQSVKRLEDLRSRNYEEYLLSNRSIGKKPKTKKKAI